MRPWALAAAIAALVTAVWWHLPAAAQRAPTQSAASEAITFEQYRDFRLRDLAQRQARLARQLSAPGVTAEKTSIERRKAYYDQMAAMPEAERDTVYRERFDEIDTNHDGTLDVEERAAWREKQRETYRQQAAGRAQSAGGQR